MGIILEPPSMDSTALIVSAIAIVGTISTIILTLRRERNDIDKKNVESLMQRVSIVESEKEDVKRRLTICEDRHAKNLEERGKLQGQLETTMNILKDRNPETEKFMAYMTKIGQDAEVSMKEGKEMRSVLGEIRDFMHNINESMKGRSVTATMQVTPVIPTTN